MDVANLRSPKLYIEQSAIIYLVGSYYFMDDYLKNYETDYGITFEEMKP